MVGVVEGMKERRNQESMRNGNHTWMYQRSAVNVPPSVPVRGVPQGQDGPFWAVEVMNWDDRPTSYRCWPMAVARRV